MSFPKPYADAVAKLRVPVGFVLAAAFVWFSAPSWNSLLGGLPVSAVGLAVRAWASGHLEKNLDLAEGGPYAYVRNPLYVGTLTVGAGLVIASRRWELGVLFGAVFLLIFLPVVELEEQHLRNLFPAYEGYARRVPKFVPQLTRRQVGDLPHKHFQWILYRRNREYEALAGFLAGVALLCWKAWT